MTRQPKANGQEGLGALSRHQYDQAGTWFIFGESGDGYVDLRYANDAHPNELPEFDIEHIRKEQAENMIRAWNIELKKAYGVED
jgi:hypothetical protein